VANRKISEFISIPGAGIDEGDLLTLVHLAEADPALRNKKITFTEFKNYLNAYYPNGAGGTFSGNVLINANLTVTGQSNFQSVSVSGLSTFSGIVVQNNATVSGTISGTTITGTALQSSTLNAVTATFTALATGVTAAFTTGVFSSLSGATVTGTDANFTTGTFITATGNTIQGTSGVFQHVGSNVVSGTTVTGTTANFTNGNFNSLTGVTVTGTNANFTTGTFITATGITIQGTSGVFQSISGTTITGTTVTGTTANFTNGNFNSLSGISCTFTSGIVVDSLTVPDGTTAERPVTPLTGNVRFNTSIIQFEGYNGTAWGTIGGGAKGGGPDQVFFENDQTVTTNYTLTSGKNAVSAGPVTINSGITVTIPSGTNWVVV
jgi:hypothetical protein